MRTTPIPANRGTRMCQALVGAVLIAASAGMAQATRHTGLCGADLPAQGRQTVQSGHTTVVWAPSRWPIPVGQHFSLTVQVCAPEGQTAPAVLRVDADMPLHKHGMNYRTTLKELGPGRARAEGLMFHMPGRWRVMLDLAGSPQNLRLSHEVDVP